MKNNILLIIFILLIVDICYEVNFPKVNEIEIETDKIVAGEEIRIVQISDLHNKMFLNNNEDLYSTIRKLNSDIIVLTGDITDRTTKDYQYVYSFIDNLIKINPNRVFRNSLSVSLRSCKVAYLLLFCLGWNICCGD